MASATRQRVLSFTSPDLRDLFFWERDTLSRVDYTDLVNDTNRAYGTAHPDTVKFPNHKLVYWELDPDFPAGSDGQDSLRVRKYYVADRADQEKYNFEFTAANIGGQKFNAVKRTFITSRSSWDENAPAMGAAMSREPDNKFPTGYILAQREQRRIGSKELDALYIVEVLTYVERVNIVNQRLDPATGGILNTTETLYYRGEDYVGLSSTQNIESAADNSAQWGLSDAGVNKEVQQLSHDCWMVTAQDVIPQGLSSEYGGKVIREYDTWQNFTWPSVVDSLHFNTANRKDGASQTTVTVRMKEGKDGFSGPTQMTVKQVWKKTRFTSSDSIPDPVVFKTSSAKYSGIQYKVSVSRVLTPAITLIDFIGTKHPTYKMGDYAYPKPWCRASDPTDWPSSVFPGSVTQKPFRGGYLLEVVSVHPPS